MALYKAHTRLLIGEKITEQGEKFEYAGVPGVGWIPLDTEAKKAHAALLAKRAAQPARPAGWGSFDDRIADHDQRIAALEAVVLGGAKPIPRGAKPAPAPKEEAPKPDPKTAGVGGGEENDDDI